MSFTTPHTRTSVPRALKKAAVWRYTRKPLISHIGSPDVAVPDAPAWIYTQGQMLRLVPLKEAQGDDTIRCRGL